MNTDKNEYIISNLIVKNKELKDKISSLRVDKEELKDEIIELQNRIFELEVVLDKVF